jgi:hypothetical protein
MDVYNRLGRLRGGGRREFGHRDADQRAAAGGEKIAA